MVGNGSFHIGVDRLRIHEQKSPNRCAGKNCVANEYSRYSFIFVSAGQTKLISVLLIGVYVLYVLVN